MLSFIISNLDADPGLCPITLFNILKRQDLFEVPEGVGEMEIPGIPSTISGFRK